MADIIGKDSTIQQVREEWSKYNDDRASNLAFGEAKSPDTNFARNLAKADAISKFGKKQNTKNYQINGAIIKDEKLYSNADRTYSSLVLVEVSALIPDEAVTEQNTGGNSATLNDAASTVVTGTSEPGKDIEFSDHFSATRTVKGEAVKNGKTYTAAGYTFYTKDTEIVQKDIWNRIYEDIAGQIFNDDIQKDTTINNNYPQGYAIKTVSFNFTPVPADRPKEQPTAPKPPAPQPPSTPPIKKGVYYPKAKMTKPKSAGPGEFIEKISEKQYKGYYIETSDKKYFAGKTTLETGIELIKVKDHQLRLNEGLPTVYGILADSVGGFHKRKPTNSERENGILVRFFVMDKNNNKIVETDKATFTQTQLKVPNKEFAQVNWVIKGPAEDQMFGQYPYEGAATKNKKAIQALETTMPGISTVVTDYSYLVEDPAAAQKQTLTKQTTVERDANTQLENDRKANFDLRK